MIDSAFQPARGIIRPPPRIIAPAGALVAGLAVVIGQLIKGTGGRLGVPFPPFYAHWYPYAGGLVPVTVIVLGGAAAVAPRLAERVRQPVLFCVFLYGLALALGISLNVARGGVHDLWAVFKTGPGGSLEAYQEYLPGLSALTRGVPYYVAHFPALIPSLPIHVQGNPPGPLVAVRLLGIQTPGALAALVVGLGALSAPLAYDLGRTLGGEDRGRVAGLLTAFSPALLLWGVTSADYAFSSLGLVPACLLARRGTLPRAAGVVTAAAATFFSWLLFAIAAWAAVLVVGRDGVRRGLAVAVGFAVAVAVLYLLLALTLGYDPVATIRATGSVYRHGISRIRPYAYWLLGSPAAWWIGLGLPTGWCALRAAGARDAGAIALFAVIAVSALVGLTKAETERIWLPFVPLACVAAAAVLPIRRLPLVLWLLVVQTLAVELLFDTVW
jgi:hypothetical protein